MKKISSKRKKTEADLEQLAHLEFLGSLYTDNGHVVIPGEVVEGILREGAKRKKLGADFTRAVECPGNFPLIYDGPNDPEKLWKEERFRFAKMVKVQRSRILRTRVIFDIPWSCEWKILYDETVLNETDIEAALIEAGIRALLLEWKGKFGAFTFEKI